MAARGLLLAMVLVEAPVGLLLLLAPRAVAGLLLGVSLDAPAALVVARIAGAAILSLILACLMARTAAPNQGVRTVIVAMLLYNCAALGVLVHAAVALGLVGILMWPAVAIHAALAAWCGVAAATGPAGP
jgi:hypothetical protein